MFKIVINYDIMEIATKKAKMRPAVRKSHPAKRETLTDSVLDD